MGFGAMSRKRPRLKFEVVHNPSPFAPSRETSGQWIASIISIVYYVIIEHFKCIGPKPPLARSLGMRSNLDTNEGVYLHVAMAVTKAKLFQHGGSQAVRLPREFRFQGREVRISQTERGVLLESIDSEFQERRRRFAALAGSCPELTDVPPHATPDLPRDA